MRFGIKTLLLFTSVVAVWIIIDLRDEYQPREIRTLYAGGVGEERFLYGITAGVRRHKYWRSLDRLDFCIIERVDGEGRILDSVVHRSSSTDMYHPLARIELNSRVIQLPSNRQLHEVVNGHYRAADEKIDLRTLESFKKEYNGPPSIDALLTYRDAASTHR